MKASIIYGLVAFCLLASTGQSCSAEAAIEISSKALAGCRAPEDPGCSRCCIDTGDSCIVKSWISHENSRIATPWYNSLASEKECPSDCAECASCSQRSEEELRALLARRPEDCDCAKATMGIDPCFAPMSCACYCSRWEDLRTHCPYPQ
jgi:hypothetical protein